MSQRPSLTAVMPEPEPVGLYVNVTPLFASMKASPSAPMTFSIEVEPSVATVPLSSAGAASAAGASVAAVSAAGASVAAGAAELPHAVNSASARTSANTMLMVFFIFVSPFLF